MALASIRKHKAKVATDYKASYYDSLFFFNKRVEACTYSFVLQLEGVSGALVIPTFVLTELLTTSE